MVSINKKNKKGSKTKSSEEHNEVEEQRPSVVSGQLAKKISKKRSHLNKDRGVLFVKHLPHGFFEEQMKNYFNQFGRVTRLRLVRSRRTGNSRGFAFVEFEYPEVAQIAAETMNNYLMFHRLVKASYIPPEERKFNYFKTSVRVVKNKAGKEIFVSRKTASIQKQVKVHNDWSDESYQKRTERTIKKLNKLQKKCSSLGIDFAKCMVQPKKLTSEELKAKEKEEKKDELQENNEPGSLLLIRKRKINTPNTNKTNKKKVSKKMALEDLLGDTLVEEGSSEDEDFVSGEESSKEIALKDLLGDTLIEEDSSEDEDFVAGEESSKKIASKDMLGGTLAKKDIPKIKKDIPKIKKDIPKMKTTRKTKKTIAQNRH